MTDRPTTVLTSRLAADCHVCGWTTSALNGLGIAARHHDTTGHPVTITVERRIVYGDPSAPPPGQTELFRPHPLPTERPNDPAE